MGPIYPGTCSNKSNPAGDHNLRVRIQNSAITFTDGHYGLQMCELKKESGDYVIFRANQQPSYILAVTVDDVFENYTEVVRGSDLLAITFRQVHLTQLLVSKTVDFFHIPIVTDQSGNKLSKQTHAPALKRQHARYELFHVLKDLGQNPPKQLLWKPLWATWEWAHNHWRPDAIPLTKSIFYNH